MQEWRENNPFLTCSVTLDKSLNIHALLSSKCKWGQTAGQEWRGVLWLGASTYVLQHMLKQSVCEHFPHMRIRMLDGFMGSQFTFPLMIPSKAQRVGVVHRFSFTGCSRALGFCWGTYCGCSHCLWWMHVNSPPVASKGVVRKSLRKDFGSNTDIRFSCKRSTAKRWLYLVYFLEAPKRPLLRHYGIF